MSVTRFYCPQEYAAGNSLVNWLGRPLEDILTYAETYRSAACRLVHAHRELNLNTPDHQVLPILFLYRHSLELFLKAIIYHGAEATIPQDELTIALPRLWREHSLVKLQKMAIPVFQANDGIDLDPEELEKRLASTAHAIDEFDTGSYAFRYPVTTTGFSSLPPTFMVNMFFYSDEMESLLTKCLTFCQGLKRDVKYSSAQMKLALHSLNEKP
jgi:hypothetical protein